MTIYQSRTLGYMNVIKENPDLIKGKIVLDVGCGTGVLSKFASFF
jgi:predicted RNA methylase